MTKPETKEAPWMRCVRCGYKWLGRKRTPRSCPRCKSYTWQAKAS